VIPQVTGSISDGDGTIFVYASFTKTKPADGVQTDIACHGTSGPSAGGTCELGGQFEETTVYLWIVETGGFDTTIYFRIGEYSDE